MAIPLAAIAAVYLMLELASFVGLRLIDAMGKTAYSPSLIASVADEHREILTRVVNGEAKYIGYSRELGWTTLAGGKNELFQANSQGVRGSRDYARTPPDGVLRVAAFGDSFIHGDDVPNEDAWSILMEGIDPRVEVMNFGVGGYGPDQAYLRYLAEGREYSPQVVFIGFQTENINRIVNVYRPFYSPTSGNPLAKPRFTLEDGELILHDNPIRSLAGYQKLLDDPASVLEPMAEEDFHVQFRYTKGLFDFSPSVRLGKTLFFEYKSRYLSPFFEAGRYRTSSEHYRLLWEIVRSFHCDVAEAGSLPIVVLFPNRADLAGSREDKPLIYGPLKDQLQETGRLVIDLLDALAPALDEASVEELVQQHYTAQGNELVARYLLTDLSRQSLFDTRALREAIATQQAICGLPATSAASDAVTVAR